jgi:hypothetical protein
MQLIIIRWLLASVAAIWVYGAIWILLLTNHGLSSLSTNTYFFAHAPHMLKLLRNWLIDTGSKLENGKIINQQPLVELIRLVDNEVSVCFKLTEAHTVVDN